MAAMASPVLMARRVLRAGTARTVSMVLPVPQVAMV